MPNQFPQLGLNGKPFPKSSIPTGWIYTDCVALKACPKCASSAGFYCESPKGRKVWPPHSARMTDDIVALGSCSAGKPADITRRIVEGSSSKP